MLDYLFTWTDGTTKLYENVEVREDSVGTVHFVCNGDLYFIPITAFREMRVVRNG